MVIHNDKDQSMKDFLSRRIEVNYDKHIVNYGQGFAIGAFGSYKLYVKSLSKNGRHSSVHIGKDIDTDTLSIIDDTNEFIVGDIPKLLVKLTNVSNDVQIRAIWQDEDESIILESSYGIPSPYTKRYDWWSVYCITFQGPGNLKEGKYNVIITSKEMSSNKELSTNIDFAFSD